ncbi:hypothetical protein Q3V23_23330 [Streptomyces sp. VNUA116]|uniref:hypothetical protein n=1 Tax=Streptomyces sp. VNUA116 TaxID=3062449 RepID=UPI0026772757|nr:hypothetical protein [Streptomyces sp. VNUA116]WKU46758.1 hypothetical protein Q3V23_23330 [Streptomyces sp. VNUA116]
MSISQDRASVEAYAQWLLRLLDLKKVTRPRRVDRGTGLERLDAHRMPLSHFTDAIPFGNEAAWNWRDAEHGDQSDDVFTIATPADVDNRLNIATVQRCDDPGTADHDRMMVRRLRFVKRPIAPAVRAARHTIEVATLVVTDEALGLAETHVSYYGTDGTLGGQFSNLLTGAPADVRTTTMLRIALGLQFMRRYDWHVRIQGPKGTGLLIPATATGCRNLLKERDLADGEVRRASLVHLVAEHQRRKPSAPHRTTDPDDLTWVREHSRGRRKFTWNGMQGEVLPSQDVVDRLAAPT